MRFLKYLRRHCGRLSLASGLQIPPGSFVLRREGAAWMSYGDRAAYCSGDREAAAQVPRAFSRAFIVPLREAVSSKLLFDTVIFPPPRVLRAISSTPLALSDRILNVRFFP